MMLVVWVFTLLIDLQLFWCIGGTSCLHLKGDWIGSLAPISLKMI